MKLPILLAAASVLALLCGPAHAAINGIPQEALCDPFINNAQNCARPADQSVAINISTGTTTQLVALVAGQRIFVTSWDVIAGGTGNISLEYGTGSNCGSGTTALTGAYNLTAQQGISKGSGLGTVLFVPQGNALCALTTASVQMSGSLSYTQAP